MKYALCVAVAWTFFLSLCFRVRSHTKQKKPQDNFDRALKNLIKFYKMYREKIIKQGLRTKSEVRLLTDGVEVHFFVLLDSSLKLTFLFGSKDLESLVMRLENYFVLEVGPIPVMDGQTVCYTYRKFDKTLA